MLGLTCLSDLKPEFDRLDRILREFRDRAYQENHKRRALEASVQRYRLYRSDNRSELALSRFESKRGRQAIRDDVMEIHRQIVLRQSQIENLTWDHKSILGILEHGACIRLKKRPRAHSTGGGDRRKT